MRTPAAAITPTRPTESTQTVSWGQVSTVPFSRVRAGIGATRPAEEIAAAAEAAVWFRLFSSIPKGRKPKARLRPAHIPKPRRAAVTDMFMPQPIFRPR